MENIHRVAVTDIAVRDRFRQDLGDLDAFAQDIADRGLLCPVLLRRSPTKPFDLIDGERRLRACRDRLGRRTIEARLLDVDDLIDSQIAANTLHKEFTLSERTAIGLAVEARLGERRGGDHGNQHVGGKRQDIDDCHGRRTDAIAAERSGFGNRQTYRNAKQVVLAARREPEKYARLVERMDSTGKVDGAFRELASIEGGNKSPHHCQRPDLQNTLTPPSLCRWIYERLLDAGVSPQTILDPCAGSGNLTQPFHAKVIEYEIQRGSNFFEAKERISCDLVLCNPPWSEAERWLRHVVEIVGNRTPMVFICPLLFFSGYKDAPVRKYSESPVAPTLHHITPLPQDTFVKVYCPGAILWLNLPKVRHVALVPSEYLVRRND